MSFGTLTMLLTESCACTVSRTTRSPLCTTSASSTVAGGGAGGSVAIVVSRCRKVRESAGDCGKFVASLWQACGKRSDTQPLEIRTVLAEQKTTRRFGPVRVQKRHTGAATARTDLRRLTADLRRLTADLRRLTADLRRLTADLRRLTAVC